MEELGVIEKRFIQRELKKYAEGFTRSVRRVQSSRGFSSGIWNNNSFAVGENEMEYRLPKAQRFVDMKTRNAKGYTKGTRRIPSGKEKKKYHPVYNNIVMGWKKYLVRSLSFGFTEEVKNQFQKLEQK